MKLNFSIQLSGIACFIYRYEQTDKRTAENSYNIFHQKKKNTQIYSSPDGIPLLSKVVGMK